MGNRIPLVLAGVLLAGLLAYAAFSALGPAEPIDRPEGPAPARTPDESPIERPEMPDAPGEVADVAVAGRVTGPDGRPLAGATVAFLVGKPLLEGLHNLSIRIGGGSIERTTDAGSTEIPTGIGSVRSAADGTFVFRSAEKGPFSVRAELSGYAAARRAKIERGTTDLVLALGAAGRVIGVVQETGGLPLAGAVVMSGEGASAVSGADGRFVLEDVPVGDEVAVRAHAMGYEAAGATVSVTAGGETELPEPLVLAPGPGITGRVFAPDGKPLPGVGVSAMKGDRGIFGMANQSRGDTDAGGRYSIGDLEDAEYDVVIRHEEYLPRTLENITCREGERVVLPDVRLEPGGVIAGRVTGEDGTPIGGARVGALAATEGLDFQKLILSAVGMENTPRTDAEGRFRLAGLEAGTYSLMVGADGYRRFVREDVAVEVPHTTRADVTLSRGASIAGRVVDSAGNPIADAKVSVEAPMRLGDLKQMMLSGNRETTATTAADGKFTITGLGEDAVSVVASRDGYASAEGTDVEPGTKDLTLRLGRTGSIVVTVLDAESGKRLESAEISCPEGGVSRAREAGEYEVNEVPPGVHSLTVSTPDHIPSTVEGVKVAEGEETAGIEVRLTRGATLVGIVTDVGGDPVDEARVIADGPLARSDETDDTGRFEVRGLAPGTYSVSAHADEMTPHTVPGVVVPQAGELRIVLGAGGSVRGRVLDDEGQPASGRMIVLQRPGVETGNTSTPTDSQGEFEFLGVAPGKYSILVVNMAAGFDFQAKSITVADGEETFVTFGGEGGRKTARLKGRLVDRGQPVANRMLILMRTDGDPASGALSAMKMTNTDSRGRFDLKDLEPGRYAVLSGQMGSDSFGAGGELVIDQAGQVERDIELPPGTIAGTVRDAGGDPIAGARIGVFDPSAIGRPLRSFAELLAVLRGQGQSGKDGSFEMTNVKLGRGIVEVHAEGYAPTVIDGVSVTERAGAGFAVRMEKGHEVTVKVSASGLDAVGGAVVFVFDAKGRWLVAASDLSPATGPDGKLSLRLQPGRYRFQVQADGYAIAIRDVTVSTDTTVPVELAAGGTVSLVVTGDEGPVAGADCRVYGADGREIARLVTESAMAGGAGTSFTDESGLVTLTDLPAGELRIRAATTDGREGATKVRVANSATTEAALHVK